MAANTQTETNARRARWAERSLPKWLFFFFLALYFLTLGGHLYSGDGFASYATARSFVEGKGGALDGYFNDPRFGLRGPDGKQYSKYGIGQVVVELPFVLAIKALTLVSPGLAEDPTARFALSSINLFVCAFTAVLLCGMVRRLGYGVRVGVGVAMLYGLATMSWAYSKLDFSEPLVTLCYLMMARSIIFSRDFAPRALLTAGAWLAAAVLFKSIAGIAIIPLAIYILYRVRLKNWRRWLTIAVWLAGPVVAAIFIVLAYNLYRYGSITETGYSAIPDQFALGSFYGGIFGFLLSPGKSMFLYAPGLIFAVFGFQRFFKGHPAVTIFSVWMFLTYLFFYANFWNWEGDWTWGPRYLMPVFPFMALWAAPLLATLSKLTPDSSILEPGPARTRLFFNSMLVLGIIINLLGSIVEFNYYFYVSRAPDVGQDWRFVPELSPIRGQIYLAASAASRTVGGSSLEMDYLAWDSERVHALSRTIKLSPYDQFDFWWLRSANPAEGANNAFGGLAIAAVIGLLLGGLIYWCWRKLRYARAVIAEFEGK